MVLAGLGNPGARYAENRHNCGFLLAERAVKDWNGSPWQCRGELFLSSVASIGGITVQIIKPQCYMNRSGIVVKAALEEWSIPPARLIVAHDDLDLDTGRLRIRFGGGHGGHNGLRSIIEEIGTSEFVRLKMGIGRPTEGVSTVDHVLGDFADDEWLDLQVMVGRGVSAAEMLIAEGVERTMNLFNRR